MADKKSTEAVYTPIGHLLATNDVDPVAGKTIALTSRAGVKVGIAINYSSPLIK